MEERVVFLSLPELLSERSAKDDVRFRIMTLRGLRVGPPRGGPNPAYWKAP
jgi:hypothetical protein